MQRFSVEKRTPIEQEVYNREFASQRPELRFLVTRIVCGIAGFKPEEIAPLFADVLDNNYIWSISH